MYVNDDLAAFHSELWLSYWKSCNNCVRCWRHYPSRMIHQYQLSVY